MPHLRIEESRLENALWHLVVSGSAAAPALVAAHRGEPISGVTMEATTTAGEWAVSVPVPAAAIRDGAETLMLINDADHTALGSVALVAGNVVEEDLRAEVALLRAELDMLKQVFRRHSRES